MPASVVVLPSEQWPDRAAVIAALRATGLPVVDIDLPAAHAAPRSVRTCAALLQAEPATPMRVIAHGDGAELLPAVALAQRTAHRAVADYVLIAPDADPSAQDWPDAPVTVIASEGHPSLHRAQLRGWSAITASDAASVGDVIVALP